MNEPTMETLARRLDRLERENRRLKGAGVVALAVIAAVGLMGQLPQATPKKAAKAVEAEKFVLLDPSGKERAILSEVEGEGTVLFFYDQKENPRLGIGLLKDAPIITLFDKSYKGGLVLNIKDDDDTASLAFVDNSGNNRITLTLSDSDVSGLALTNRNGTTGVALSVNPDGMGGLGISEGVTEKETARGGLSLTADGLIALTLLDKDAKSQLKLGVPQDGPPGLILRDKAQIGRVALGLSPDGSPLLGLVDRAGKVIWSAP